MNPERFQIRVDIVEGIPDDTVLRVGPAHVQMTQARYDQLVRIMQDIRGIRVEEVSPETDPAEAQ